MKFQPAASHFINGAYVEDRAGREIPVIYPAMGAVIARLHAATPEIVDMALDAAKNAQREWAAMSGAERGRILRRAADIMRERNYDLVDSQTKCKFCTNTESCMEYEEWEVTTVT